jgi:hypothetical protein
MLMPLSSSNTYLNKASSTRSKASISLTPEFHDVFAFVATAGISHQPSTETFMMIELKIQEAYCDSTARI